MRELAGDRLLSGSDDPTEHPAVLVEGLGHDLGRRALLRDIDLRLEPGASLAIVGPSGSGKTTLLHLLAGIVPPQRGSVAVAGHDLGRLGSERRAALRLSHVGLVFQFGELLDELTVEENVALPLRLAGHERDAATTVARRWVERVGLDAQRTARPATLSGGEVQRAAVARALVASPRLILADEPTGALDQDNGAHVVELLLELTRTVRTAVVIATHDLEIARRADTVHHITDGRLRPAHEVV